MANPSEGILKVGAGYFSEWLNEKTLAIGGPEAINVYNIEKMEKINEAKFQPGFYPADFSFGISNKLYYEDQTDNPDIDISYIDITTQQKGKVIKDARSPIFVK
jgi:adenine-specific DNA methylase